MQQLETTIERLGPVASAALRSSAVDPFEAFVAPGDVFRHPREVLTYSQWEVGRGPCSWPGPSMPRGPGHLGYS
jgi:hypothetical protein